jgi:hypothetical protein
MRKAAPGLIWRPYAQLPHISAQPLPGGISFLAREGSSLSLPDRWAQAIFLSAGHANKSDFLWLNTSS